MVIFLTGFNDIWYLWCILPKQEFHKLQSELQLTDVNDLGSHIIVTFQITKMKKSRTFTVTGKYLAMVQNYLKLRPKNVQNKFFLLNYPKDKCTSKNINKISINKIGTMAKVVAPI